MTFLKLAFFSLFILPLYILAFSQTKNLKVPDYTGERMEYNLKAGAFNVGKLDIEFRDDTMNCPAYIICNARSSGMVTIVKDVHYMFDACMDTANGHAIKSSRRIREGNHTDYDLVNYNRIARKDSVLAILKTKDTLVIAKDAYDILVAFFQFRKNYINPELVENSFIHLNTFFVDTTWGLNIRYGGKEVVKTTYGTVTCYKFFPQTMVSRYFKTTNDMTIWVTANKSLIPVKFEARMKIATFTAELEKYVLPKK
ncbi:MAG: DUF3108 domain-containing protein [Bacteroidota bacterium]|nr:MAG: DUF3108 domain-containing protein [Bacteroidota bacterium]